MPERPPSARWCKFLPPKTLLLVRGLSFFVRILTRLTLDTCTI